MDLSLKASKICRILKNLDMCICRRAGDRGADRQRGPLCGLHHSHPCASDLFHRGRCARYSRRQIQCMPPSEMCLLLMCPKWLKSSIVDLLVRGEDSTPESASLESVLGLSAKDVFLYAMFCLFLYWLYRCSVAQSYANKPNFSTSHGGMFTTPQICS